jgi:hypothetical protein
MTLESMVVATCRSIWSVVYYDAVLYVSARLKLSCNVLYAVGAVGVFDNKLASTQSARFEELLYFVNASLIS